MVFFFYGPNTYASRRKLRELARAYVDKTGSDWGLERIDGETVTANALSSALESMPFLASSRLVIIEKLGLNKAVSGKIESLIAGVPETTVAAFYETEVDQRSAYFKAISKIAKSFKFELLGGSKLQGWISAEVSKRGGSIDATAARLLVDLSGDDQWRLEQEISKLVNYNPRITAESVRDMVEPSQSQTIFDLVDAMTAGRTKQALTIYRGLIGDRMNEIYILTMITWQLRNLLLAKVAGSITPGELAKAAGMSPYVAGKAIERRRDFEEAALRRGFLEAVKTDYRIKSGGGEAERLVERLIYRISSQGG